jgi:hypothetical protein
VVDGETVADLDFHSIFGANTQKGTDNAVRGWVAAESVI